MTAVKLSLFLLLIFVMLACGSTTQAVTPIVNPSETSLFATVSTVDSASVTTSTPAQVQQAFQVAVLVDSTTETVSPDQVRSVMADAGKNFLDLTGFSWVLTESVTDDSGGSTTEMINRYIQSHASSLPDGILIFSYGDNGQAKLTGGYSYNVPGPAGYHNRFISPVVGGDQIYVAVVDFSQRYAACGYGGGIALKSQVSIDGECSRQSGTACMQHNGYSMCSNVVGDLYSSTPTYYAAHLAIHGFMNFFSPDGDQDHYATSHCNAKMGWPQGFYDNIEAEYHNDVCPFVYENFVKSYQP